MKHYVYKLTDPSGKSYIGVTKDFKRRMKEHRTSKYPIGVALREFGEDNFKVQIEEFETKEIALDKEFELVSIDTLSSLYNLAVGGGITTQLVYSNPMKVEGAVNKHPNTWTSEHNPMKNESSKQKMIESQKRKAVSIEGVGYNGVREAARAVGESRQLVVYRLKSATFPTWFYL